MSYPSHGLRFTLSNLWVRAKESRAGASECDAPLLIPALPGVPTRHREHHLVRLLNRQQKK